MKEDPLKSKSYEFAIRIVQLARHLQSDRKEYVLQKQILRSGTAIGALISEAKFAQSRADFINKMHIALKEANETIYWISILKDTDYIDESTYNILFSLCNELVSMLAATVRTSKSIK